MKVVHISRYYKIGGAAKSALRLHNSLLTKKIQSYFISIDENVPNLYDLVNLRDDYKNIRNIHYRIFNKISRFISSVLKTKKHILLDGINRNRTKINAEFISHPFSDYRLEHHPIIKNADIIHLHWVSDEMLDFITFFKNCNKPIVWTLHDMNPFQGLFHYKNDYIFNANIVKEIDEEILNIKRKSIRNYENSITIVTPSKWLAEEAFNSGVFANRDIITIPYGLDLDIFKPIDTNQVRLSLNLPQNTLTLLFIAESLNNPRKGFNLLIEAIKNIDNKNILIITIGEKPSTLNDISNLNIKYTGRLTDETQIAKYFAASDAFILPSIEDNLPNVMLESLSCGTPIIAFPIGGIKEHIKSGFNGILAEDVTPHSLMLAIKEFIENNKTFDRNKIRQYAISNFDEDKNTLEYISLYNKIANTLN